MAPSARSAATDAAREFLHSRIDYERAWAMPYGQRDFRLDRMRSLLDHLGRPQDRLTLAHVAGTKGKGSTSAMLAALLTASGRRTGLFTSPHLERVEERLAIDGQPCSAAELADLVHQLRPAVLLLDAAAAAAPPPQHGPTYFEILTALALLHFAAHGVDAAVLEVGLGGRLDSTNVCSPRVSIITSISFDHTQQLGHTLAAIAGEKAGIIKPGVPVVSGVREPEPRQVISAMARDQHSPLIELGRDLEVCYRPPSHLERSAGLGEIDVVCRGPVCELAEHGLPLALVGQHQAENAALAVCAATLLVGPAARLPRAALVQGLAGVEWPARIEVLSRRPTVVVDSAHNLASVAALLDVLDTSFEPSHRVLVFATSRDKDAPGMLAALLPRFHHAILTQFTNNPRGLPPEQLAAAADRSLGCQLHLAADPPAAWQLAGRLASRESLVCSTGSVFLAAQIRALAQSQPLQPSGG
jgi:dihydrofolate synthase/folylpolyglutamate synthase